MKRSLLLAMAGCALLIGPALAQEPAVEPKKAVLTPAQRLALADKVRPSFVVVEYTLQFDKGEPPPGGEQFIRQERPLEYEGWLIAPDQVITRDLQMHPRFIKQIDVRAGDQTVPAKIAGYYTDDSSIQLKLDSPLKAGKPLEFKPDARPPYYFADYSEISGRWTVMVMPVEMSTVAEDDSGRKYVTSNAVFSLVIDGNGDPVALRMIGEFPLDASWKRPLKDWPMLSEAEMQKKVEELGKTADASLLRVKLHFRSPRKDQISMGADQPTEQTIAGVLLAPDKLMVLANMDPKLTARLERVMIYPVSGEPIEATFVGTMTDYGCLLAKPSKPLAGPFVSFSDQEIESFRNRMLLAVDMRLQGDQRIVYYVRNRLARFDRGWKRRMFPETYSNDFLFDAASGQLVCLPLAHREKLATRERYRDRETMMPAGYVAKALADGPKTFDAANVPLTEEEESRLAWLGVELQAMDEDLARANKISDLTRNGSFGAMVSYVYAESPAAKAGVQPGWIIVRLHAPDQPKPIDVRLERLSFYLERYPWDRWDELPEQYFERIPRPWPPVETSLIRSLTDLGFGKKVRIDFWAPGEGEAEGKIVSRDFAIEQSPAHFDTAPRYNARDIGLTVRDMTYEVCRYFRKKAGDPGVIISKIEPGSKASVAGIKPFEVVTTVNDEPVKDVKQFEALLTAAKGELRLGIKRMARGRLVKIDLAAAKPATKPDTPQED